MNDLKAIFELDFKSLILAMATIIIGFNVFKKALIEAFGWMGIETKWMRDKREQKEDLEDLKGHNVEQDGKIDKLMEGLTRIEVSVDNLSRIVGNMQKRNDENEAARIKDRVAQAYRYYHGVGKITKMEKEALEENIRAYSQYSDNSFIHSVVEKELPTWTIVDE